MPPEETPNTNTPDAKPPVTGNEPSGYQTPNLRTYKDDIKNVVESQDITSTRILLDEQRRRAGEAATKEANSLSSKRNRSLLFISLALIALAGGIVGFIWFYPNIVPQNTPAILARPHFLEADGQTLISIDLRSQRDILADMQRLLVANIPSGMIEEVHFTRSTNTVIDNETVVVPTAITTTELFQLLETRAPEALVRSLEPEFMLGLHGTGNAVKPYLLFKIADFENVFASMLGWEVGLSRDMQAIFFPNIQQDILSRPRFEQAAPIVASTTSTSTPAAPQQPELSFDPTFYRDRVIQNTDARAIVSDLNDLVFFYTFLNDDYLVFAQDEATLTEVVRRLRQAKLIR